MKNSQRPIDQRVSSANRKLKSSFVLIPSMQVKTWKAMIIIMFVAGFSASMIWAVDNNWLASPFAKTKKADKKDAASSTSASAEKRIEEFRKEMEKMFKAGGKDVKPAKMIQAAKNSGFEKGSGSKPESWDGYCYDKKDSKLPKTNFDLGAAANVVKADKDKKGKITYTTSVSDEPDVKESESNKKETYDAPADNCQASWDGSTNASGAKSLKLTVGKSGKAAVWHTKVPLEKNKGKYYFSFYYNLAEEKTGASKARIAAYLFDKKNEIVIGKRFYLDNAPRVVSGGNAKDKRWWKVELGRYEPKSDAEVDVYIKLISSKNEKATVWIDDVSVNNPRCVMGAAAIGAGIPVKLSDSLACNSSK